MFKTSGRSECFDLTMPNLMPNNHCAHMQAFISLERRASSGRRRKLTLIGRLDDGHKHSKHKINYSPLGGRRGVHQ